MTNNDIRAMIYAGSTAPYDYTNKQAYKRHSLRLLRELRLALGYANNNANASVRFNPGGIAVCGDAILHSDRIYVRISNSSFYSLGILYRAVKGTSDYTGGPNHYYSLESLKQHGVRGLAEAILTLLSNERITKHV